MALADLIGSQQQVVISSNADTSADFVGPPPGDDIVLDASIEESHSTDATITEYPVEVGPNISDSSRVQPEKLSIRGFVTGTPVSLTNLLESDLETRGTTAYEALRTIQQEGRTCTVTTTLRVYEDMLIESLTVPRTAQNSDGVELQIEFKRLFTAQSATVSGPVPALEQPKASTLKKAGAKALTKAKEAVSDPGSLLFKAFGG